MRSPSRTGKSFWRAGQRQFDGVRQRIAGGEGVEVGDHGAAGGLAGEGVVGGGRARLGVGAEPDEGGDQDEERVAPQEADHAEDDGQPLADAGGEPGGAHPVHAHGERGAQDAAAVHGEGGQEVEEREHEVRDDEGRQQAVVDAKIASGRPVAVTTR